MRKWRLSRALLTPGLCLDSVSFLLPMGFGGTQWALDSQLLDRREWTAGICTEPSDDGMGRSAYLCAPSL